MVDQHGVDEALPVHQPGRREREEVVADQGHARGGEEDQARRRVAPRMEAVDPDQDADGHDEVERGVVVVHADDQPRHRVHGVVDRLLHRDPEGALEAPQPVGVREGVGLLLGHRVADERVRPVTDPDEQDLEPDPGPARDPQPGQMGALIPRTSLVPGHVG